MTIGLVFLSLLMAVIVWWLFRQTVNVQPWQAQAATAAGSIPVPAKMGLWVFLGVASSLFVLFVSAYAMRLGLGDWSPLPRPRLLVLNTARLMLPMPCRTLATPNPPELMDPSTLEASS